MLAIKCIFLACSAPPCCFQQRVFGLDGIVSSEIEADGMIMTSAVKATVVNKVSTPPCPRVLSCPLLNLICGYWCPVMYVFLV